MFNKKSAKATETYTKTIFSENGPKSAAVTNPPKKDNDGVITKNRIKAIRNMRSSARQNADGGKSTHVMEWGEGEGKYKYQVNPTIFPEKDGSWKDLTGKGNAAYIEARKRGEVVGFKSKRRAERVAAGSWKKGNERRESMKEFRRQKRNG